MLIFIYITGAVAWHHLVQSKMMIEYEPHVCMKPWHKDVSLQNEILQAFLIEIYKITITVLWIFS